MNAGTYPGGRISLLQSYTEFTNRASSSISSYNSIEYGIFLFSIDVICSYIQCLTESFADLQQN